MKVQGTDASIDAAGNAMALCGSDPDHRHGTSAGNPSMVYLQTYTGRQGLQQRATILVTGVENPLHPRGFLAGPRTNVALTRAQGFSFVIGSSDCFRSALGTFTAPEDLKNLIKWHEGRQSVIHIDPSTSSDLRSDLLAEYMSLTYRRPDLVDW